MNKIGTRNIITYDDCKKLGLEINSVVELLHKDNSEEYTYEIASFTHFEFIDWEGGPVGEDLQNYTYLTFGCIRKESYELRQEYQFRKPGDKVWHKFEIQEVIED